MGKKSRRPKKSHDISTDPGVPDVAGDFSSRGEHSDPFRFRFDMLDLDDGCEWSMGTMSEEDHRDFLTKLKQYERLSPQEAKQFKTFDIYQNFGDCPNPKATRRLEEKYEGCDTIARFRLNGKKRLFGVVYGNEFHILWWDPEHAVWPSKKRHT